MGNASPVRLRPAQKPNGWTKETRFHGDPTMLCVKRTEVVSPLGINSEGSGQSPLAELGSSWGAAGHPRSVPPDLLQVFPQVSAPGTSLPVSPACPQVSLRCPPPRRWFPGFHLAWSIQVPESPPSGAFPRSESLGRNPLVSLHQAGRTGQAPD